MSVADVLREFVAKYTMDNNMQGNVTPSTGITKPTPEINNGDEAVSAVNTSLRQKALQRPVSQDYADRRYEFISREEGVRYWSYDDHNGERVVDPKNIKGLVTVGVGFNMDRKEGNSRDVFKAALGLGDSDFDNVRSGKRKLSPTEVRKLADFNLQEAESIVNSKFKGVELSEHQRLSLVSLAFNNPSLIGKNLTKHITEGNHKAAVAEILFKSNAKSHGGLAKRRYREAMMFAGKSQDISLPPYKDYLAFVDSERQTKFNLQKSGEDLAAPTLGGAQIASTTGRIGSKDNNV